MPDGASLYETDFHAWSRQQVEALRAAARAGSKLALDFETLAEEVEDLGKGLRTELRRCVETIVEHLLKLQFSPSAEPRAGWRGTVRRSRREVASPTVAIGLVRPHMEATRPPRALWTSGNRGRG